MPKDKLIVALDVDNLEVADRIVHHLVPPEDAKRVGADDSFMGETDHQIVGLQKLRFPYGYEIGFIDCRNTVALRTTPVDVLGRDEGTIEIETELRLRIGGRSRSHQGGEEQNCDLPH